MIFRVGPAVIALIIGMIAAFLFNAQTDNLAVVLLTSVLLGLIIYFALNWVMSRKDKSL